ncbi:hypothetical protein BDE36_2271 [Arcticibacter tournemirensis]|nr:hypothetical protein BDE36_2271 [Arcticibacter tournemirensis]
MILGSTNALRWQYENEQHKSMLKALFLIVSNLNARL